MTVAAFVQAAQARDAAAARAALSPGFRGTANGKAIDADAQVRLLEAFWGGFPDAQFRMEPTGGSGRHVITWTLAGTHGGVYLGVPPTGAAVAFSGFIIAVSDATGITSLDWKWDTKAFTKAVLGPDQVGDLEVKDTFRDPSRRWQNEGPRRAKGQGKGKGRGGNGRPRGGPRQDGPRPLPGESTPGGAAVPGAADATPVEDRPGPGQPGQPSPPGQGRRRRRGKGPRGPGAPGAPGGTGGGPEPSDGDASSGEAQADAAPALPTPAGPATDAAVTRPDEKPGEGA